MAPADRPLTVTVDVTVDPSRLTAALARNRDAHRIQATAFEAMAEIARDAAAEFQHALDRVGETIGAVDPADVDAMRAATEQLSDLATEEPT